jgi:WhiB family redox-sensing transcriptional regulator
VANGDDWREQAACAQRPDLDWFDLDCYLLPALQVCARCPVADACLAYAIRHGCQDGLWGGEWGYRLLMMIRAGRRGGGGGH